jgi:excinuclease ABC subunit B
MFRFLKILLYRHQELQQVILQEKYNAEHGITPKTIKKDVHQIIEITSKEKLEGKKKHLSKKERQLMIAELTKEMKEAG